MLFVAGIVLAGVAFEFAHRRDRPAEIALLLGLARISVVLVAVGGLLLPVFGLWLVHLGNFGYGSGWVDAAIALYVVVLVLGGLGDRRPKEARLLAMRLAAEGGPTTNELRAPLDDRVSRAENDGSLLILRSRPAARRPDAARSTSSPVQVRNSTTAWSVEMSTIRHRALNSTQRSRRSTVRGSCVDLVSI